MQMRDDNFRSQIRSVADILVILENERLMQIGDLHVRGSLLQLGGINGFLAHVEGETAEERFAIALPLITGVCGRTKIGARKAYPHQLLKGALILPNGAVRLRRYPEPVWIRGVEFKFGILPYDWTETRRRITTLVSRYANESGLSVAALGRDLPTERPDFNGLAQITIDRLQPVLDFISAEWHEMDPGIPMPSRETISATLAALSMRGRRRQASRRFSASK